jgi:uncharacterized protein YqfB (UPF0267 family)
MSSPWEAASAIGTIFLGFVAVIPIGLRVYKNHKRRQFHIKQLNMHLSVLHKKLKEIIDNKSWGKFNKISFESINRVNFDSIEYLFSTSSVLRVREQEELRVFCVFFKPFINMRTEPDFKIMKKKVEQLLSYFPSKSKTKVKQKISLMSV